MLPDSDNKYDWLRCARFGLYGSCYVAPTLYSWLTVANIMWPGSSVKAAFIKVTKSFKYYKNKYNSVSKYNNSIKVNDLLIRSMS